MELMVSITQARQFVLIIKCMVLHQSLDRMHQLSCGQYNWSRLKIPYCEHSDEVGNKLDNGQFAVCVCACACACVRWVF